jgi:signal peptidase I
MSDARDGRADCMLVAAHQLMPVVRAALQRGQQVRLTVRGGSMRPFIQPGAAVELEPLKSMPEPGDVLLVQCGAERYVLHRLVRAEGGRLFIRGDAQLHCEGPFAQGDVLGRVAKVVSRGRVRRFDAGPWRLAGRTWHLCAPLSVWLFHLAVRLRSIGKRESV